MPPLQPSMRHRLAAATPLLIAAACLFVLALTASSDEYRESGVATQPASYKQSHAQQWTTSGGDVPGGASEAVEVKGRKARVGLAGAKQRIIATQEGDELTFTVQHEQQARVRLPLPNSRFSHTTHSHDRFYPRIRHVAETAVTYVGDFLLDLIGFDAEEEWFSPGDEEVTEGLEGGAGAALAGWSESTVFVERTNALYPSRPSSFGPHLVSSPLRGFLFPITSLVPSSDSYACSSSPSLSPSPATNTLPTRHGNVPEDWIALVQRGKCPFSDKVRVAQEWGAKGVVFGDMEESEGGIGGGKGLLTPWSPDDTEDILIPSLFVSRISYLSLLRAWEDEQELAQHQDDSSRKHKMQDGETQTDALGEVRGEAEKPLVGLEVVLSKEEMFAWPLLDLLFLLLFLPSLLTLVTVFTQRVRVARAAKAERAPKEAVARLPVFRWGDTEKGAAGSPAPGADDEERDVGSQRAGEGTPLLPHEHDGHSIEHPSPLAPSLLQRGLAYLPTSLTRHFPSRFAPLPPASTAYPRIFSRPTRRFPTLVECPFCLSDFERGDLVMELPCGHVFHEEEVVGWLEGQRGVCPVCRTSVVAQPGNPSSDSSPTDPSSDPTSTATPLPPAPINADGAAILVNYLRPPLHSTTAGAPFEPPQRTYAASPVASSSSVPIEGLLAAQVQERERAAGEQEEVKPEEGK
ncbi:hypothetical protein JCM11251_007632 [Rhodosporidiobolus azoricus]